MNDDMARPGATGRDVPRQDAAGGGHDYSLSIEEALARYEAAGIPRTRRSVQRYCANGAIDAHRIETPFGEKFLIVAESVDRHIAYIREVRLAAARPDLSRQDATRTGLQTPEHGEPATWDDKERQATATIAGVPQTDAPNTRVVELLERENHFLRDQILVKDKQIADQLERAHETNALVSGLQRMLTPLLAGNDRGGNAQPPH